ncbi:FAD-dependent monooxygenase [Marinomonas sp. GJ51-6]|uniref:FAD-dependent monooxygenase n=1 Tax=Marinomonas sp. GJ51-6 TaxID=2992802 RepID=UPI002934D5BC|nr:FAD-dependent monooxygenase [Marinomonas sp. GJ51-6]WOD06346.1 FAD-dependent monooxygenase [Marinomonas sp. GJ51-6]
MSQVSHIIIVGAGIGGLSAALAFAKQNVQVTVLEQAECFGEVGAGLQISPNVLKVLRYLGLETELSQYAFTPQHASMRDYKTGDYYLKVPLADQAVHRYGAPYWHLHRADLHRVLVNGCKAAGVEFVLNANMTHYDETAEKSVQVTLDDGRTFAADLLVGADGIHSTVREQMLGYEKATFMGQVAWRGIVPVSELKVQVQPDACVWVGPNRHFVSYYLRGGEYVNFVAVEERDDWRSESWREEGNVAELKQNFSGWHPEVTEILYAASNSFLWALNGRDELPTWHQGRVALLGDACHPMLPFMAQGAAMAIEDAYVLAKCVADCRLSDALIEYEKIRKPRATKIQKMSKANASLYHMHGGLVGKMKLKALKAASQFAPDLIQSKLDPVYGYDVNQL